MIDDVEDEMNMIARHLDVLQMVIENEPIGIVKMSDELGYAHHEIRYSLRILQEGDLIDPTQQGAVTTDRTNTFTEQIDGQIDAIQTRIEALKIDT